MTTSLPVKSVLGGTDGHIHAVIVLAQLLQGDVLADVAVRLDLYAGGQDGVDVAVQILRRQTIGRDAVAQHTAQLGLALKDLDPVAHKGEEVGRGQTGGAAADDGDLLARLRGAGGHGDLPGVVHGEALDAADVQGGVHDGPAAVALAGMLTHQGTHGGEGVVLADQTNGVGIAPLPHQGDVAGGIDVGGAQLHAGDALEVGGTAALGHVGQVVVLEGHVAVQDHLGRLEADGAVGAVDDGVGRAEDGL